MDENEQEFDNEDEDEIVILNDEDGNEIEFYHIATIDYKEKWYILLSPVETIEDDADPEKSITDEDVVIFEIKAGEDGDDLIPVEDDEILDAVYDEYMKEVDEE